MVFATIFLVCFVLLGGVVMFLSKTIDHGEARFDSETGKPIREPDENARPATRLTDTQDPNEDKTGENT